MAKNQLANIKIFGAPSCFKNMSEIRFLCKGFFIKFFALYMKPNGSKKIVTFYDVKLFTF